MISDISDTWPDMNKVCAHLPITEHVGDADESSDAAVGDRSMSLPRSLVDKPSQSKVVRVFAFVLAALVLFISTQRPFIATQITRSPPSYFANQLHCCMGGRR